MPGCRGHDGPRTSSCLADVCDTASSYLYDYCRLLQSCPAVVTFMLAAVILCHIIRDIDVQQLLPSPLCGVVGFHVPSSISAQCRPRRSALPRRSNARSRRDWKGDSRHPRLGRMCSGEVTIAWASLGVHSMIPDLPSVYSSPTLSYLIIIDRNVVYPRSNIKPILLYLHLRCPVLHRWSEEQDEQRERGLY